MKQKVYTQGNIFMLYKKGSYIYIYIYIIYRWGIELERHACGNIYIYILLTDRNEQNGYIFIHTKIQNQRLGRDLKQNLGYDKHEYK